MDLCNFSTKSLLHVHNLPQSIVSNHLQNLDNFMFSGNEAFFLLKVLLNTEHYSMDYLDKNWHNKR